MAVTTGHCPVEFLTFRSLEVTPHHPALHIKQKLRRNLLQILNLKKTAALPLSNTPSNSLSDKDIHVLGHSRISILGDSRPVLGEELMQQTSQKLRRNSLGPVFVLIIKRVILKLIIRRRWWC